jgi:GNAT superfamily N-acetyltransferase
VTPSLETVERTLAADIAYTISRMKVLERLPGNPIGIGYRWIDESAVALTSRLPAFARVVGLRAGHESHIEGLARWYRDAGIKPAFEIVPGHHDTALGRELARHGFFHSGFHASLITGLDPRPKAVARARIEVVETEAAMEDYLEAYVAGWGIPDKDQEQFKANVRPWLGQPGWTLYVARADGKPAAAATLFMHERVGYLADAATAPSFRGRGLQMAMLRRRMAEARDAGADIAFSGAAPFSTSHRNMERAGLRLQFMRALWTAV